MEIQGIKVLRYEHSLFFLNKEHFRAYLYKCVGKPSKIAYNRIIRDKILQVNVTSYLIYPYPDETESV
jgi:hypothetical protein